MACLHMINFNKQRTISILRENIAQWKTEVVQVIVVVSKITTMSERKCPEYLVSIKLKAYENIKFKKKDSFYCILPPLPYQVVLR